MFHTSRRPPPPDPHPVGWDHGVFIPLLLINPPADIPIIQLSVLSSEDPHQHFLMGRALYSLRSSNVAILGSGFASFHNLPLAFSGKVSAPAFKALHGEWNKVLADAVLEDKLDERRKKLEGWRSFSGSDEMHVKGSAEHFMPLLVCAAAGGEGEGGSYTEQFMGLDMWSYYWT